jgi:uncharacterized RDD family membrane protein YckC
VSDAALRANPYVGLRPFFTSDSLYFFGRARQTAALLQILHEHRFLGVVGSSGSGKSSIVRAGLLPRLLGGFLVRDRDRWRSILMKPGDAPIANLAAGLLAAMGETPTASRGAELEQSIRDEHTDAVVRFLAERLEPNGNVLLLVDQFEEIFAFRGTGGEDGSTDGDPARRQERARRRAEAADFVDLLLALAERRDLPLYVTLTMRTDFLGDCDLFYGLPEALNRGRYLVPRMTRQELREAIEGPALLMRARVAPRLLDYLLNDLGDRFDRLPVLQHALQRTWDGWRQSGGVGPIDVPHFTAAGGLEGALDQDAEAALKRLDLGATARVFKRLTDTDASQRRVRRPARVSELVAAAGVDRSVVDGIVRRFHEDGRSFVFTSPDGRPDDPRVDISHESLIRQWNRLRSWVDEERRSRDQYIELVARARRAEQGVAAPLQDPELQIALAWKAEAAPTPGWAAAYSSSARDFELATDYVKTSLEAQCRRLAEDELQRRWRRFWNPLILAAIVLAGAVVTERAGVFDVSVTSAESAPRPAVGDAGAGPAEPQLPVSSARAESLNEVARVGSRVTKYWYFGFFALAYFALVEYGRRIHRRLALPRILHAFLEAGGRRPSAAHAETGAPRDAVDVHQTTYASTARRVAGYAIDLVLYVLVLIVSSPFVVSALDYLFGWDSASPPDFVLPDGYIFSLWGWLIGIGWLYETLPIISRWQATPGMRLAGVFRTGLHGERLSFPRTSAWYFYRLVSYIGFGLGFLIQPFTKRRQTFHDRMAGSVVLRRPRR